MTLGEFITFKREQMGFKKMQFSELLGIGDDSLRSWEKDRFKPAGQNMINLISALGLKKSEVKHYFGNEFYGLPD